MKLLYTLFSFLFFLLVGNPNPQLVSIVHNLPSELMVGERVLISIDIDKSTLNGFGLVELKFPDNCIVGAGELANGSFTFENNKARIVWMKMPEVKMLHISYYLTYTGQPGLALDFHGTFSHIEENYRVDEEIPSHPIITNNTETIWPVNSSELAVVENPREISPDSLPTVTFTPKETIITDHNDAASQIAFQEPADKKQPQVKKEIEVRDQVVISDRQDVPSDYAAGQIYFRVQILAAHRTVNKSYLASTYGFQNDFNIEHHNGWMKYVTGMFDTPELARAHRDELNASCHDLPGPFITAYHNSERITVQEALMLQSTAYRY